MCTTVALGLLLALALIDSAQSEGNGTSIAPRILEFKKNMHRLLEGSRIRHKRQLYNMGDASDYKLRFDTDIPEDLPYLSDYSITFWIPVYHQNRNQVLIGTTQGKLFLFELSDADKNVTLVADSNTTDVSLKAKAFSFDDEQWFSVLHTSVNGYFIRMYLRLGRGLEPRQEIVLPGASDIEMVTMKGIHYMVVASYNKNINQGLSYETSVVLYHWIQTQFDRIASRTTYGARSVACWVRGGSIYIIVGQEVNNEGNYRVGSPIYFYNSRKDKELVLWQILQTFGPTKVQHFYVAGSHYVIFIGRQDAVIYWWSSGQFLEWQTLSGTAYASDLSVLSLNDGEVAIVIGLKENAVFYTLDASGYYIVTYTMNLKQGSTLASLQFMFSGSAYYALALFAGSHERSIRRLTLKPFYLPSVESLDSLQQCLSHTKELLDERESELSRIREDLKRVWLKGSNQIITSNVTVKGKITSVSQVKTRNIIIAFYTKLPESSMGVLIASVTSGMDSVEDVKNELDRVVRKSTRQDVKGTINLDHIIVPSLTMESTHSSLNINDIEISRMEKYALRKFGDQIFSNEATVSNVYAEGVTVRLLNGKRTEDLLLLHGKQVVMGDLHFSNTEASTIATENINTIPVEDIVTTKTKQVINGFKEFSALRSDVIEVQGEINWVNLGDNRDKIATIDDYKEFSGKLDFQSPVTIHGNIFLLGKINKVVEIPKLASQSVSRNSQQDLTGLYRFEESVTVAGELMVAGSLNGIPLDNVLTLTSNQKVYADITFHDKFVAYDLLTDTVNGVDFKNEVVRKFAPEQFITGQKIFTENIFTDFVDMTDYVTLDGTDPSRLVQDIVQHRQGVVKSNSTSFKNVVVLGNITAFDGINGFEVKDLPYSVWLKNLDQRITVPVEANTFYFKTDVDVKHVNKLDLHRDVVSNSLDDAIQAEKHFSQVYVKTLKTSDGVTINGIDPKSFQLQLDHYIRDKKIHGTKTLKHLVIEGELMVEAFNDQSTSEIMQPHARQTVFGPVFFSGNLATVLGNTRANSILIGTYAELNVEDYFQQAVVSGAIRGPLVNKDFLHLGASNLVVPEGSTINGVSLHGMLQGVVTLNTPQAIASEKNFASAHFSKLISVSALNDINLLDYINDVVFTDQVSQVTNKRYESEVRTTNAFVRGTINGIKLEDLAANIFYKSEDNEVMQLFTFKGDVDIANLYASSNVDGVDWKNLIFLNEDEVLGQGWFLDNIHAYNDIFVTGRLNGCDLSELASKSVYSHKSSQIISEHINVQSIIIIGNVVIKNVVNKVPFEQLKQFITTSDYQDIESDVVLDASIAIKNLSFKKLANSVDISEIVGDAVRHSLAQDIKGQKTFKEGLHAEVMSGGDVSAHLVNGIILEEIYRTTVWKNGHQEIYGDKIFPDLFSNVATVKGSINGLRLPQDVVLTDTSEHISHPTYFMSDLYVPTDVSVHGLIDGVNINRLILERVTLLGVQNITAQLSFWDDIVLNEEMTIDGTVNELVLDLVAKVNILEPLQGYKVFVELYISGPTSALSVNGYDVPFLASNILRYNKEDYINGLQVFEEPITTQNSLLVDWINGVSVKLLMDTFAFISSSLKNTLGYLEDFSYSLQQQTIKQMSATTEHISRFAYFALFQEINLGPTNKILYGYNLNYANGEFSHSMIIWTKQKHCIYMEKCCHLEFSYWLRVKKDGLIMVEDVPESGRYYPINYPSNIMYDKNFFIWTNITDIQPKWCAETNQKMFLSSYNNQGLLEVFVDVEGTPSLSEIKSFRKGNFFSVAGYYYDTMHDEYSSTVVYVYDDHKRYWSSHQILPSFGVLSLDIITYNHGNQEDILLATGTGIDTISSTSAVYRWNNVNQGFEVIQNIPSRHVTSTLWIRKGRDLMLSLAGVDHWPRKHVDCTEMVSGGQINIYSYYKERLKWIQSIPLGGVVSLTSFSVDGDVFLAAASIQLQTIYIYEWQGYASFVEIQTMFVGEVRHISTYEIVDDIYMTVAMESGPSKILKMVRKGQHFKTKTFNPTDSELNVENQQIIIPGC